MVQAPSPDVAVVQQGHQDLPQALLLLNEMNVSAQHVASLVDNMLQKVRLGELSTDQGLSFLEMKYNMLLSYLINLTYVVLLKCSGIQIENDPCIDRLVEIRTVLEKIRPIDHKLKYQIDKLVKTAANTTNANDPTSFKANPEEMNEDVDSDDNDSDATPATKSTEVKSNIYVPPKLSSVIYPDDKSLTNKKDKLKHKASLSAAIMQDLREEYLDTPLEIAQTNRAQQLLSKQQKERQEYEEEYFTRLPVERKDKHLRRSQLTTLGSLGDEVTDFGSNSATGSGSSKRKRRPGKAKGSKKNFKKKRFH